MAYRLLLDTSSLMYRAFFALPASITDGRGRPTNAVHGYLDFTSRLLTTYRPEEAVHVYDHDWRPAPRVARYPGYKATRQPDPEALPSQFDLLRELLDAMGQPQAEAPGWEADDAIGALCAVGKPDDRFDIVTGDRDLIQLVRDPPIRVLYTLRGVSQLAELDEAAVFARYGVPASRYADFAVLRGDPSDGLPGVPGVGEKTARALVSAYPSLDTLAAGAAADRPGPALRSPRLRDAILGSAGYLEVMREVVPIRTDVEVRTWAEGMDEGRVGELATRHKLAGPIRGLRLSLDLLPHPGPRT